MGRDVTDKTGWSQERRVRRPGELPDEPLWQVVLGAAGWALLTFTLLVLLGVGLPILLAATLASAFPNWAILIGTIVGLALTIGAVTLLGRETQRRAAERPRLRRALMGGYGFALMIGVPALILWFGYWLITGTG